MIWPEVIWNINDHYGEPLRSPNLIFLSELDNHSSGIAKTKWNADFKCYFKATKNYQLSEVASLQNEVLELTG